MSKSKRMTQKEYVATKGVRCPKCRGLDICAISTIQIDAFDACAASQDVKCDDCKAEWTDRYKLVGYSLTPTP